jgi:hypothetical protein
MNVYRKERILLILLLGNVLHLQLMQENGSIKMEEYSKLLMGLKPILGRKLVML